MDHKIWGFRMSYVKGQYYQSRDDDADLKRTSGGAGEVAPGVGKRRRGNHLTRSDVFPPGAIITNQSRRFPRFMYNKTRTYYCLATSRGFLVMRAIWAL